MYGGLGDRYSFGLHDTSHYLAPVIAWNLPSDWTLRVSPGFGLNDNSHRFLLRWGVSREFSELRFRSGPDFRRPLMSVGTGPMIWSCEQSTFNGNLALLRVGADVPLHHAPASGSSASQTQIPAPRRSDNIRLRGIVQSPQEGRRAPQPARADRDAVAAGAKLYALHCAECHGETGEGGKGPRKLRAFAQPKCSKPLPVRCSGS